MWSRGLWRRLAIGSGLYGTMLVILGLTFGSPAVEGVAPVMVAVLLLAVVVRYAIARRNVYGSSGRMVYDDARTIEFSVEGVYVLTEGGVESRVPWTHFEKAERRGFFTLLFMTKLQHFIVPDEAFATQGDRAAFEALLQGRSLTKTGTV